MQNKKSLSKRIDKFNPIIKLGLALLIIGSLFSLTYSILYHDPIQEDNDAGMGMIGGGFFETNQPCAFISVIFSLLALSFAFIAYKKDRYDVALIGSLFLMVTLIWPSMIMGMISFVIFFAKGFD